MGKTVGEVIRERHAGSEDKAECHCEGSQCRVLTDSEYKELRTALENGQAVKQKVWSPGYREEIPDQTPVAIPVGMQQPEDIETILTRVLGNREALQAAFKEIESPEEAEDFDIDDGEDPISPLQHLTMAEDLAQESKRVEARKKGGEKDGGKNRSIGDDGRKSDAPDGKGGKPDPEPGRESQKAGNPSPNASGELEE